MHRRGLPDYRGIKVSWEGSELSQYPDIRRVAIPKNRNNGQTYCYAFRTETVGTVGGGGNSGYQAVQLAAQLGARRIVLIGFDMKTEGKVHWYGRNRWTGANNPDESNFRRWIKAFNDAVPVIDAAGIEIVNASPHSGLECFSRMTLPSALEHFERA